MGGWSIAFQSMMLILDIAGDLKVVVVVQYDRPDDGSKMHI
jgi:hypothetical protein